MDKLDRFDSIAIAVYVNGTTKPVMGIDNIKCGKISNTDQFNELIKKIKLAIDSIEE